MLEWSLTSLTKFMDQKFVFATRVGEDIRGIERVAESFGIGDFFIHQRGNVSSGQAETVYDATEGCGKESPLWIYNIDTYVEKHMLSPVEFNDADGLAVVFKSKDGGLSYIEFNDEGIAIQVAEKRKISSYATVGLYGFSTVQQFRDLYVESYVKNNVPRVNGETYIAPMYQLMI